MALSLEIWGTEQSRRSPVVSAAFWLQIEAGKHTTACCLFFPEGASHFPPANFLSQDPREVFLAGGLPMNSELLASNRVWQAYRSLLSLRP